MNRDFFATELIKAVCLGETENVDKIINFGLDVNTPYSQPFQQTTLLNMALKGRHYDTAKILVQRNADLDKALYFEVKSTYNRYDKQLSYENIKFLLQNGANVNAKVRGLTVLEHNANKLLDHNIVSMLLNAGAQINVTDTKGLNVLHKAVHFYKCKIEVICLLLQAGAHVNVYTTDGFNALTLHILTTGSIINLNVAMLLLAGGELLQTTTIKNSFLSNFEIPRYLFPDEENKMTLKYKCRDVIRNQLLYVDKVNLFLKVPKLPLPTMIKKYILFNQNNSHHHTCTSPHSSSVLAPVYSLQTRR